jgi:outer membrane biogenesis lipoprotein LolB
MFAGLHGRKRTGRVPGRPLDLLEFRPWMLALAVLLACAMGIAIMERTRDDAQMWAQAQADLRRNP